MTVILHISNPCIGGTYVGASIWPNVYICLGLLVCAIRIVFNHLLYCAGPSLNISVESSTSSSTTLSWTGADERVNYYNASNQLYSVLYTRGGVDHVLLTSSKSATVPGLEPDTEYTFFVWAWIEFDAAQGPLRNLTCRTETTSELYEKAI